MIKEEQCGDSIARNLEQFNARKEIEVEEKLVRNKRPCSNLLNVVPVPKPSKATPSAPQLFVHLLIVETLGFDFVFAPEHFINLDQIVCSLADVVEASTWGVIVLKMCLFSQRTHLCSLCQFPSYNPKMSCEMIKIAFSRSSHVVKKATYLIIHLRLHRPSRV